MSEHLRLTEVQKNKWYQIAGFIDSPSIYSEKLYKMGFVEGTSIQLAPVKLSDPLVFQIRGSRIALRKKEAEQVLVREV